MRPTVFTIGHSTRALDEFLTMLRDFEIDVLVDVRRFPGSRRFPHFSKENLSRSLADAGIEYRHALELGGRRAAAKESPNRFWRSGSFRAYADHMATPEFQHELEELLALGTDRVPVIMCAEAVPWRCHRQLISDALVARECRVRHIMAPGKADDHKLNPGARVAANGLVTYPGDEADSAAGQTSLFEA